LLGSPIRGSETARRMATQKPGRLILGHSLEYGLLGDLPAWPMDQPLFMIAGNRGFGLGQCLPGSLPGPNDGTVMVQETQGPEVTQHWVLPVSHSGLLFSQRVCTRIIEALQSIGLSQP